MKRTYLISPLLLVQLLIVKVVQSRSIHDFDKHLTKEPDITPKNTRNRRTVDDYSDYYSEDVDILSKPRDSLDNFVAPPDLAVNGQSSEHSIRLPELNNHAPEYMMELYNLYSKSTLSHPLSNIVRSFMNINAEESANNVPLANMQGRTTRIHSMIFNITSIPAEEIINLAELRLFTLVDKDRNFYLGVDRKVSVFEVRPQNNEKYRLIDSKHIYGRNSNWETFDVTSALKRWVHTVNSVQMLEVRIESVFHSIDFGDMDIDTRPHTKNEPLLVVFSNEKSTKRLHTKERHELVTHEMDSFEFVQDDLPNKSDNKSESNRGDSLVRIKRRGHRKQAVCRRRPLYIHFKDIDWDRWIIAPQGYQAYECVGKCYFPFHDHLSPTKHSIIQTLLHSKYPRRASRACCVPTKLDPISILYLDEDGVVTFKYKYDGMVVAECGCR